LEGGYYVLALYAIYHVTVSTAINDNKIVSRGYPPLGTDQNYEPSTKTSSHVDLWKDELAAR
jgi:hypothetical protein